MQTFFHDVGVFHTQMVYKVDCTNISLTSIPTCDMLPVNCTLVFELYLNDNKIGILPPNGLILFDSEISKSEPQWKPY